MPDSRRVRAPSLKAAGRQFDAAVAESQERDVRLRELLESAVCDADSVIAVFTAAAADEKLPAEMRAWCGDVAMGWYSSLKEPVPGEIDTRIGHAWAYDRDAKIQTSMPALHRWNGERWIEPHVARLLITEGSPWRWKVLIHHDDPPPAEKPAGRRDLFQLGREMDEIEARFRRMMRRYREPEPAADIGTVTIEDIEWYRAGLAAEAVSLARSVLRKGAVLRDDTAALHARLSSLPPVPAPLPAVAIPPAADADLTRAVDVLCAAVHVLAEPWTINEKALQRVSRAAARMAGRIGLQASDGRALRELHPDRAEALGRRVTIGSGDDTHIYALVDVAAHSVSHPLRGTVHGNRVAAVRPAVVEIVRDGPKRAEERMVALELEPTGRRGFWLAVATDREGSLVDPAKRIIVEPAAPRARVAFHDNHAEFVSGLVAAVHAASATVVSSTPADVRRL